MKCPSNVAIPESLSCSLDLSRHFITSKRLVTDFIFSRCHDLSSRGDAFCCGATGKHPRRNDASLCGPLTHDSGRCERLGLRSACALYITPTTKAIISNVPSAALGKLITTSSVSLQIGIHHLKWPHEAAANHEPASAPPTPPLFFSFCWHGTVNLQECWAEEKKKKRSAAGSSPSPGMINIASASIKTEPEATWHTNQPPAVPISPVLASVVTRVGRRLCTTTGVCPSVT